MLLLLRHVEGCLTYKGIANLCEIWVCQIELSLLPFHILWLLLFRSDASLLGWEQRVRALILVVPLSHRGGHSLIDLLGWRVLIGLRHAMRALALVARAYAAFLRGKTLLIA